MVESSHDSNSYIGVPMIVGETVIGVIGLNGQQDRRMYTDHDLPLLNTLASTIAVAVQNAIQFEEAQRRANREALVNEISQKIQNAPTIESAMQTAVTELGKALGVQRAVVELNKKPKNGQPN
ncbi:MAG: GAF domain-containing protein [Chloroflexi bacterium]|nr:GAF domain-containing protein [Chloroflexota bacterium]